MSDHESERHGIEGWIRSRTGLRVAARRLTGDVSARRYYRVESKSGPFVVAVYPPELRGSLTRYVASTELLASAGVAVPRILDRDPELGYVLLEDLGSETVYDRRDAPWPELRSAYRSAIAHRHRILGLPRKEVARLNPPLDGPALERELAQTYRQLLEPAGMLRAARLDRALRHHLAAVCAELGQGEAAPCHRDFMVRNLIPRGEEVVVIDHQDLRLAPFGYDLASLLNDSLFPPREEETRLLGLAELGPTGLRGYRLAAVQRTFKAAGTFAAFARRGQARHLPLVAPTLRRGLDQLACLEDGRELAEALRAGWAPLLVRDLDLRDLLA